MQIQRLETSLIVPMDTGLMAYNRPSPTESRILLLKAYERRTLLEQQFQIPRPGSSGRQPKGKKLQGYVIGNVQQRLVLINGPHVTGRITIDVASCHGRKPRCRYAVQGRSRTSGRQRAGTAASQLVVRSYKKAFAFQCVRLLTAIDLSSNPTFLNEQRHFKVPSFFHRLSHLPAKIGQGIHPCT